MGDLLFVRKCYIMNAGSDVKNWIATLDKLMMRSDRFNYVVPGHGAVVTDASALKELQDYLIDLWNAVTEARRKNLTLEQAKQEIRLEEYADFEDYDRMALDVEACWHQVK
jgi:glyoxylase-like metal-dependent hydrolase (beta-lactamase superfamily II)